MSNRPIFREQKIWAFFVAPTPNETLFVGLSDAELSKAAIADWTCLYWGDQPGEGVRSAVTAIAVPPNGRSQTRRFFRTIFQLNYDRPRARVYLLLSSPRVELTPQTYSGIGPAHLAAVNSFVD